MPTVSNLAHDSLYFWAISASSVYFVSGPCSKQSTTASQNRLCRMWVMWPLARPLHWGDKQDDSKHHTTRLKIISKSIITAKLGRNVSVMTYYFPPWTCYIWLFLTFRIPQTYTISMPLLQKLQQERLWWDLQNGLIRVKEEGWTDLSEGWQVCSGGFCEGEARGKSRGVALPPRGKLHPSWLFYSD